MTVRHRDSEKKLDIEGIIKRISNFSNKNLLKTQSTSNIHTQNLTVNNPSLVLKMPDSVLLSSSGPIKKLKTKRKIASPKSLKSPCKFKTKKVSLKKAVSPQKPFSSAYFSRVWMPEL
jgi:hypothetical protein